MLRFYLFLALSASLYAQNSPPAGVTYSGTVKFGSQPLPGATVIASQGDHRAVTTTDESGAYEFTALAPGTYTVEIQMFGFQTVHKQIQVGSAVPAVPLPTAWALELQPLRQREPREAGQRPQQQQGGFRATTATTENELDQIAAAAPQDNAAAANAANATKLSS